MEDVKIDKAAVKLHSRHPSNPDAWTGCRWIHGDTRSPNAHVCGKKQYVGKNTDAYCEEHYHMAYRPAKPREAFD
jgi:hypothetical protein